MKTASNNQAFLYTRLKSATIIDMEQKPENIHEDGYDLKDTQQQRLITVLGELEDEVEEQNSWRHVFIRGTLYGLGTVIGATVLLALLGSILALTSKSLGLGNIPILGPLVEKIVVEQMNRSR
jgi:Domain of unknown function (DUF5665)